MQRIHIFLDKEILRGINKIIREIKSDKELFIIGAVTRSDIIRYALHKTFNLPYRYIHISRESFKNVCSDVCSEV